MELSAAWHALSTGLVPAAALGLGPEGPESPAAGDELRAAAAVLARHGLLAALEEWLLEVLQRDLQARLAPEFWGRAGGEPPCPRRLLEAFGLLRRRLEPYLRGLGLLEEWARPAGRCCPGVPRERAGALLRAVLFSAPPADFRQAVRRFYGRSFRIYMRQHGGAEEEAGGGGGGCGCGEERCCCPLAMEQFQQLNAILGRAFSALPQWIDKVIGWLSRVFLQESTVGLPGPAASSTLKRWRCHVQMFFYRLYASMRIEELFSIIRDFPESKPAVEDLKYCLERTNQRQQLLTSLKSALELRLLHPGVNTSDIITLYISAIKALRELDSSMVILEVACEPIRKYLRTREDTVRQIVAGLTGDAEGSADLANELSKADPVTLENGQESEDDASEPEDWVPDPVDADPGKSSSKRRSSDIISLLVSIYGSKDLFINEYRTLLADRLLHQFNYSAEREIRNVELLKLRFGEAQMHYCEVMLKDMADSRRINANIRDEEQKLPEQERPPFSLVAIILSSEFWPPLKEEKLELPAQIKEAMEAYAKKYEKLKAMRTLNWKHHLGLVNLEVELADRTLSLSVSPVHAAVILHFQDKSTWTLEELSEALKVPAASLRRKMTLWLQQGVLREEPPGTFTVIEEELKDQTEKVVLIDSDEEGDSAMASQADQKEEELQLFWTYIQAMLTNLESLSLERIHSMLKIFVMTGPMVTEIDIQELQVFLQKKVRDQQLSYSGGVYRLPKSCN
ncbi:anaphase-promoting complex subunit 2 [Notechis scutatus]|uniref:Anaphase-promoting complex subunit 2 n=1 Tax=Notechis scutatus TaxID=8663 RepID=A0A6J1VGR2_9SAUR|nr:anaphase-promoting complex subunit 2 [Notechis scutatus]